MIRIYHMLYPLSIGPLYVVACGQQPRHHRSQRACSRRLGFSFEVHMISIYNRPGIGTEEKRGRAACLGFGQSRAVAAFGGVRAELMEREIRHVGRSNENVTRKLGLGLPLP